MQRFVNIAGARDADVIPVKQKKKKRRSKKDKKKNMNELSALAFQDVLYRRY